MKCGTESFQLPVEPDSFVSFRSSPELLTEQEAIVFLRLDTDGPKRPDLTLRYYREKGLLKSTRVGRRLRYRIEDLRDFLAELASLQNH